MAKMKTVTRKTLERKVKHGVWEVVTDESDYGLVEVRNCNTKEYYLVRLED